MSKEEVYDSIFPWIKNFFVKDLKRYYWDPLHKYIERHPDLKKQFPAFLLYPEKIIIYMGTTHIAVEYLGSEIFDENLKATGFKVEVSDYSKTNNNLFEEIVGFKYDSTTDLDGFPLIGNNEDLLLPTNRGYQKLSELGWNFMAQKASWLLMFLHLNLEKIILLELLMGFFLMRMM
jgi:hypothetical protein